MRRNHPQTDMALYEAPVARGPAVPDAGEAERQESIFELVDDRLRGRWRLMFIMGGVVGLLLAVAGFLSTGPKYRSDGAIRITPRIPVILEETPEHQMSFYTQFLATQMQLIRSRRVLEHALEYPDLAATDWSQLSDALLRMEEDLIIESDRNSELIGVSYVHEDPDVAQAVVNAVLHSYFDIYGKAEGLEIGRTLERLYENQEQLTRDMRAVRQDIARIRSRHETFNLRDMQTSQQVRLQLLEDQVAAAHLALGRQEALESGMTQDGPVATGPNPLQLEAVNPKLAELRIMRDNAETEFGLAKARYRPGTPAYRRAERNAVAAQQLYDQEYERAMDLWRQYGSELLPLNGDPRALEGLYANLPPDRIREEIESLSAEISNVRRELQMLIDDLQTLDDKEYEKERIQAELDHTNSRIEQLELNEESIVKRIKIAQEGYRPRTPHKDSSKKRAAAGLVLGGLFSFAAFFFWGSLDRRAFGAHQLKTTAGEEVAECLGVLPDLGQNSLTDPESSEVAAHCVHQIRNQIEAMRDPRKGFVLAVSSPFQGDGKTSIVMALGWSYATAGYNTLLVDCDLVGRSLTRQLGLIGQDGLREVLYSHEINGEISTLPAPHLSALPAGVDPRVGPESIRRIDLEDLFAEMREKYDVVIVDTGPMLGSLESTPVTASADGVVLSVRRGRSRTKLESCRERLRSIGANCVGVILNYAMRADCNRYVSEASLAAAEVERGESNGGVSGQTVIQTASSERNVLMLAMENTSRGQESDDERSTNPT